MHAPSTERINFFYFSDLALVLINQKMCNKLKHYSNLAFTSIYRDRSNLWKKWAPSDYNLMAVSQLLASLSQVENGSALINACTFNIILEMTILIESCKLS